MTKAKKSKEKDKGKKDKSSQNKVEKKTKTAATASATSAKKKSSDKKADKKSAKSVKAKSKQAVATTPPTKASAPTPVSSSGDSSANKKINIVQDNIERAPREKERSLAKHQNQNQSQSGEVASGSRGEVLTAAVAKRSSASAQESVQVPTPNNSKSIVFQIDRNGDLLSQWKALQMKAKEMEVRPYKMTEAYVSRTALEHPKLGWGYIINSLNGRLEVLFQDGIKILISNYKTDR